MDWILSTDEMLPDYLMYIIHWLVICEDIAKFFLLLLLIIGKTGHLKWK
jgi:hypothetical protein